MMLAPNIRSIASCTACLALLASVPVSPAMQRTPSAPAVGTGGMVSTAHPLATQAGVDMLKGGGNAFDAAVAIATVLNVVEPMNSGMGGYGTILVYDAKEKRARFLNCSDRIPRGVNSDLFREPTPNYRENRRGAKAVSTPGNVAAWKELAKHGAIRWQDLFNSAIKLADGGFVLDTRTAGTIRRSFSSFPTHAQAFYGRDGEPLIAGDRLVQKDLAATFRLVAEKGADAFNGGEVGRAIDRAMKEAGGFLSIQDLRASQAEWFEPIKINYRGYDVLTASPPSTAFPSLIRLGLMSQFDVRAMGHNSTPFLHRFAEATKHAFWCRLRYAGAPGHNMPPLDKLLSEAYWKETVATFDMTRAKPFVPPTSFGGSGANTTHFVVADKEGNIVTATQTLGNSFGSRIMPKGTGVWLNNSLAYCTFEPPGNPMDAHAGRHKLSGDCPTIIMKDGRPWVALGTPGGHTIGQTVPQMVMNLVDFGMDIQEAIAAPRVSFVEPDAISVEPGVLLSVQEELKTMGHNIRVRSALGNGHGLMIEYDSAGKVTRLTGGSDPRGIGVARGY